MHLMDKKGIVLVLKNGVFVGLPDIYLKNYGNNIHKIVLSTLKRIYFTQYFMNKSSKFT